MRLAALNVTDKCTRAPLVDLISVLGKIAACMCCDTRFGVCLVATAVEHGEYMLVIKAVASYISS